MPASPTLQLDCYRLQLSDLSATEIGRAAATVAAHHPRPVRPSHRAAQRRSASQVW